MFVLHSKCRSHLYVEVDSYSFDCVAVSGRTYGWSS